MPGEMRGENLGKKKGDRYGKYVGKANYPINSAGSVELQQTTINEFGANLFFTAEGIKLYPYRKKY